MAEKGAKKKKHAKGVLSGQQVLVGLEDAMGYDICLLADPRHEVFCREFAVHRNGTKAYGKAFPDVTYNSARTNASRLLTDANIQKRVAEIEEDRLDRLEVTHEKIIRELARMAFVDERDFYHADGTVRNIPDMDPDVVAAVESVKVKVTTTTDDEKGVTRTIAVTEIKHGNKREALKLLMSQRGMLKESVLHEGEIGVNHSGAVGVTDDVAKLDGLRERFRGMAHGAASTPA